MIEAPNHVALNGDAPFLLNGRATGLTLGDFWSWGYSALLSNKARGVLAEFIVASALGLKSPAHDPWGTYDLVSPVGTTIEVKSTAYLQAWDQKELSKPTWQRLRSREFTMAAEGGWLLANEPSVKAAVFALCLFKATAHDQANPMAMEQWDFWLVPGDEISTATLSLGTVEARYRRLGYSDLPAALAAFETSQRELTKDPNKAPISCADAHTAIVNDQVAATSNMLVIQPRKFRWDRAFLFLPLGLLPTLFWAWAAGPLTVPVLGPIFLIGAFCLGGQNSRTDKEPDETGSDTSGIKKVRFPWFSFLFFIAAAALFFGAVGFVVMVAVTIGAYVLCDLRNRRMSQAPD